MEGPAPPRPAVAHRRVTVWTVTGTEALSPETLAACERLLAADELERAARYRVDHARRAFVVGKALVRTALAERSGLPPASFRFAAGAHGKPELAGPAGAPPLRFSLTHTGGLVACAVTHVLAVGVDAEDTGRGLDLDGIAERHFAPGELARLRPLPEAARREAFFACWTLKESYLKARGAGLTLGLSGCAFEETPDGIRAAFAPPLGDDPAEWQFALLRPTPRHLLALSLRRGRGGDLELELRDWPPGELGG